LNEGLRQEYIAFGTTKNIDSELEEFDTTDMVSQEKEYLLKTRELNLRMPQEKNRLEFWLELIETQYLAKESIFGGKEKLILEKILSILDKAFEAPHLSKNIYLRLLRLECLRASEKNEDQYKLVSREFNSMLQSLPDANGQVLCLLLDFKLSYFITFSASMIRRAIKDYILNFALQLSAASSTADIRRFEGLLFTVLQFGLLAEYRMGYSEKVYGILFAMNQLNVLGDVQPEDIADQWEDLSKRKPGDVHVNTQEESLGFEQLLKGKIYPQTKEANEVFLTKQTETIEEMVEKEKAYMKQYWRPAYPSKEKVACSNSRIELSLTHTL
jgi:hypothetical protein